MIAILRGLEPRLALRAAQALRAGGITVIEVTTDSPGWPEAVSAIASTAGPDRWFRIGTGTVMSVQQAEQAFNAGATFLVSPIFATDVADFAREARIAHLPGALTPTEIQRAQASGATCIKVFPADTLGPDYIRRLLQPMPELRLVPTGGVTVEMAPRYLEAGAVGVALGSSLVDVGGLRANNDAATREAAERLVKWLGRSIDVRKEERTDANR